MPQHIQTIIRIAAEAVEALALINKLRKGSNGAAATELAAKLERGVRQATAARMRQRRRAAQAGRSPTGQFIAGKGQFQGRPRT